jgi:guanylate kinase
MKKTHKRVITLTGPSQAGKTTALQMFCKSKDLSPEIIPKYKTRERRADDDEEVLDTNEIPDFCDIVYEHAGVHYGFTSQSVYDSLQKGNTPLIILSDVRAIEDIRSLLGPITTSIFIFRQEPELRSMMDVAKKEREIDDLDDTVMRLSKARAVYRIYIENIHLFDHVLVNSGGISALQSQVSSIIESISIHEFTPVLKKDKEVL